MSDRDPASPHAPPAESSRDDARIAALERAVELLTSEVGTLRAELRRHAAAAETVTATHPAEAPPADATDAAASAQAILRERLRRAPAAERIPYDRRATLAERINSANVESFVGRYGTLVLATVTALAAVGTFLGWAIAHGLLGPEMRVVLGLVAAAAVTIGGHRLRKRERSFGSTLMGLGLAILHVCAWAAGPLLGIVPQSIALGTTTAASAALAMFAYAEDDQPLWCAGFGGAAVAPFVTATGTGHAGLLTTYGLAVLLGGVYALKSREWAIAGRVFLATATLFTGALIGMPERELGPIFALALPLVVAAAGALPFSAKSVLRPRLRGLGVLAAIAAARVAFSTGLPLTHEWLALPIGIAGITWLGLADFASDAPQGRLLEGLIASAPSVGAWIEGFWLPLVFAAVLPAALDRGWTDAAVAVALWVPVLLVALHRRGAGAERDALAAAASLCAVSAVLVWQHDSGTGMMAAVAGVAIGLVLLDERWPSASWVVVAVLALALASVGTLGQLTDRAPYEYRLFGTRESAVAAVVTAAWAALAWLAPRAAAALGRGDAERGGPEASELAASRQARRQQLVSYARVAPWVFAFLWVHQELTWAVSPSVATLLRVSYYAATSALCVGVGRAREQAALRHTGLALALVAAATALYGAHGLTVIAARVGAYLVVSVFLLGIAYWYRGAAKAG